MVEVLILLFTFFQFYSVVSRDCKVHNFASSLFLFIVIRSGLLTEIRRFVCMSEPHRSLCVLFSGTDAGLCIYHLFIWSKLNFLHSGSLYPHLSYTPSMLIFCICLLCDGSFCRYHHITYICYFVASYLFLL